MNKQCIRIGHPSYGKWCFNHAVYCNSKSAAVRELQNRFVPRARARKAINEALGNHCQASFTHTEIPSGVDYGIEIAVVAIHF